MTRLQTRRAIIKQTQEKLEIERQIINDYRNGDLKSLEDSINKDEMHNLQ